MNPYQAALRKKKFEGLKIEITPTDSEEEKRDANNGDGAPMVHDDPKMMMGGDLQEETDEGPIHGADEKEFMDRAQQTPGIKDLTAEEVFGMSAPHGKPRSLKDRVLQGMKGKK